MTQILQSPFSIGFCLVALAAWVLTLVAIFWPRRSDREPDAREDEERHIQF